MHGGPRIARTGCLAREVAPVRPGVSRPPLPPPRARSRPSPPPVHVPLPPHGPLTRATGQASHVTAARRIELEPSAIDGGPASARGGRPIARGAQQALHQVRAATHQTIQ